MAAHIHTPRAYPRAMEARNVPAQHVSNARYPRGGRLPSLGQSSYADREGVPPYERRNTQSSNRMKAYKSLGHSNFRLRTHAYSGFGWCF